MAREKMFDPSFQKSFTEAIHKENKIRVQWNQDHGAGHRLGLESCTWDDEPDDDDDDFVPEGESQGEGPSEEPEEHHTNIQPKEIVAEWKRATPPAVMRPVSVGTKQLLYKGLSHHGEGRESYLKSRGKWSPESKFLYPICSSWEYGWKHGEEPELTCPYYGRRQIMKTSFFRPNDPQLKPRE